MVIITDVRPGETPILSGADVAVLSIKSLDGAAIAAVETRSAWTDQSLRAAVAREDIVSAIEAAGGADAYVGDLFVGSTEI